MLGQNTTRAAEQVGHEVTALAREDLDITDAEAVSRVISTEQPEALVNCAAWTEVDAAEDDLEGAMDVNATGTGHISEATGRIGCRLVFPSTDYVFDGEKREPYVESDEPRPLSVYGQTKLAGEIGAARHNPRHFVVRSSWLFGMGGRNFVETMLSFGRDHEQVVVVKDQVGCPTYAGHLAAAIVRLLEWDQYGIYHIAGDGECSWYELALEIFEQAGIDCRVMAATTDMLDRKAPRPAYSALQSEREPTILLPDWREGLAAFLAERAEAPA
jgi:dTDP-4-dehydrorhamnose reductase